MGKFIHNYLYLKSRILLNIWASAILTGRRDTSGLDSPHIMKYDPFLKGLTIRAKSRDPGRPEKLNSLPAKVLKYGERTENIKKINTY